ncbi:hypothetical protein HanPI659440_Chr12g0454791 [Helianthus annuus]|nr:hypothetical protein HanPI659440_Chr12g0454791 [Helianthus annuus]
MTVWPGMKFATKPFVIKENIKKTRINIPLKKGKKTKLKKSSKKQCSKKKKKKKTKLKKQNQTKPKQNQNPN